MIKMGHLKKNSYIYNKCDECCIDYTVILKANFIYMHLKKGMRCENIQM